MGWERWQKGLNLEIIVTEWCSSRKLRKLTVSKLRGQQAQPGCSKEVGATAVDAVPLLRIQRVWQDSKVTGVK